MTLKELRISKGLTQKECAEYLGMSTRNYQIYESKSGVVDTVKYKVIFNKLNSFSERNESLTKNEFWFGDFNTNVVTGKDLGMFYENVKSFKKRDCFSVLKKFIKEPFVGKICVLYGLRRTGKTTLLFQMIGELPLEKTAYIKAKTTDNMSILTKDLNKLHNSGYKYVFIDEITLLSDFINTAAVLSDIFSMMGMKIVVSGTDSLGFAMANRDELYDRNVMIHTSFISFKEYSKLLNLCSVDKYIEYGGTLKMENMNFDDPDNNLDDVSFRDDESTRKYIDTAISRNIQHTLKNDNFGAYFNQLRELYDKGELTNVINRIVENMNHDFLLKVVQDSFRSHDFGSAKELLLHDAPQNRANVLYDVNEEKIIERLKSIIEIKEKAELKTEITQDHIEKVKKYLVMLDLIVDCPDRYESGKQEEHFIFTQAGMRYSIAKALVYSLLQDGYFKTVPESDKNYIINKILEDVKGRMLEEIVLLEVKKASEKDKEVFKFKFDRGGEFDMVIFSRNENNCYIYEIKHSDKVVEKQARYLLDNDKCKIIEKLYGKIIGKNVLYRGTDIKSGEINYINVERFLSELK